MDLMPALPETRGGFLARSLRECGWRGSGIAGSTRGGEETRVLSLSPRAARGGCLSRPATGSGSVHRLRLLRVHDSHCGSLHGVSHSPVLDRNWERLVTMDHRAACLTRGESLTACLALAPAWRIVSRR